MPKLDWIGKQYVVNHAREMPFRLLQRIPEVSIGADSANMIIRGDNLEALKALLPYYRERVRILSPVEEEGDSRAPTAARSRP